jgi:hypothetical protein
VQAPQRSHQPVGKEGPVQVLRIMRILVLGNGYFWEVEAEASLKRAFSCALANVWPVQVCTDLTLATLGRPLKQGRVSLKNR